MESVFWVLMRISQAVLILSNQSISTTFLKLAGYLQSR
jgi:hypothetical protein